MSTNDKVRRLPRTLRKKLEASLTHLTGDEAARLFLVYLHECDRHDLGLQAFPPLKELQQAWQERFDAARRQTGSDEYRQVLYTYRRWEWLTALAIEANRWAYTELWRLLVVAGGLAAAVTDLLHKDWVSEVARYITRDLTDDLPRPATPEEYARLTAWAEADALEWLSNDLPTSIATAWAESQGFEYLSVPREFWEAHRDAFDAEHFWQVETSEELRRLYAQVEGDQLLTRCFKGDRDLLEDWVTYGGYAGLTQAAWEAKKSEAYERLVSAVQAGELEGCLAVSLDRCYSAIPIDAEGTIPAWAALRAVWHRWLYDHGYREREYTVPHANHLDGIKQVYRLDDGENVTDDQVSTLAGDFLADCRTRPWGKGLPDVVDLPALADFLVENETPLTPDQAPDLGRVNYEVFRSREGDEGDRWEPDWVATVRSLKERASDLGFDPDEVGDSYILRSFYPSHDAAKQRETFAGINKMLGWLRVSHRAFTYRERGKQPPATILGVQFATPLERRIRELGAFFGEVAIFKQAIARLSEEHFQGLPLLAPSNATRLAGIEEMLEDTEDELAKWATALEAEPWNVDTTTLRLSKKDADEGRVAGIVESLRKAAFDWCDFKPDEMAGPEESEHRRATRR